MASVDTAQVLPYKISGPTSAPALLFLHGWPASGDMWDSVVARMNSKYRCLVPTAPHYGGVEQAKERGYRATGYTFQEVADMIAATVADALGRDARVTLIGFDMGALWAQTLLERHPQLVSRVILVDIGVLATGRSGLADIRDLIRLGVLYQYFQIFTFALGLVPGLRGLADSLLRFVLRLTSREFTPDPAVVNSRIGYAYWERHLQIVLEFLRIRAPLLTVPLKQFPTQPTLFIYGTAKDLNFYSQEWFDSIAQRNDGSTTVPFPSVHWIMFTHEDGFVESMEKWLADAKDSKQ